MAEELAAALRSDPGGVEVRDSRDLTTAVLIARELARPGDVVLLSPAGTSFDAFRDFEVRGARFKEIVRGLT
jgi:UDP-N-acetylmuramoylalanine--D-glutamate ligase